MFRPIRVDHTNCLQVAIKTHSCSLPVWIPFIVDECLGHTHQQDMYHTTGRGGALRSAKVTHSILNIRTGMWAYAIVNWRCKKVSSYLRGERAPFCQPIRHYTRIYHSYLKVTKSIMLSQCGSMTRRLGSGKERINK
jgi:hypothetical protein